MTSGHHFLGELILNLNIRTPFTITTSILNGMILVPVHFILKVLIADYDEKYAVIELMGEWNDAIENDIMELKREVIDVFEREGIFKFVLIADNVLNFHSGIKEYYQEWYEEVTDENGWIVMIDMPEATQHDFKNAKLNQYIELYDLPNWRTYKPFHLFKKIDNELMARLKM